jgi:hypothetical protein
MPLRVRTLKRSTSRSRFKGHRLLGSQWRYALYLGSEKYRLRWHCSTKFLTKSKLLKCVMAHVTELLASRTVMIRVWRKHYRLSVKISQLLDPVYKHIANIRPLLYFRTIIFFVASDHRSIGEVRRYSISDYLTRYSTTLVDSATTFLFLPPPPNASPPIVDPSHGYFWYRSVPLHVQHRLFILWNSGNRENSGILHSR